MVRVCVCVCVLCVRERVCDVCASDCVLLGAMRSWVGGLAAGKKGVFVECLCIIVFD